VLVIADGGIESDDAIGFGGCRGSCELNGNHQRLSNSQATTLFSRWQPLCC
jgi:hypothetical protein